MNSKFTRRDFLKLSGLAMSSLAMRRYERVQNFFYQSDFPQAERLGRVADPVIEVRSRPDVNSTSVGKLYGDAVVAWQREVIGANPYRQNQRWVETPEGYIWAPLLQPVNNEPQAPVTEIPQTSQGPGMWVEVSVPWVDVVLANDKPISHWLKFRMEEEGRPPRLYYSQVMWVDQARTNESGQVLYRVRELYGSPGDIFWGPAEAFRVLTPEDIAPINPDMDVEAKRVDINLYRQTLSCYENDREVYFCRISSGKVPYETDTGMWYRIWRKMVSVHMSGGTTGGGYDLPGIAWTTLFITGGIAIHSTFWHNNYGEVMSHGCINARPEDAKWIFRWTHPVVQYDPGDHEVLVSGAPSTNVRVLED